MSIWEAWMKGIERIKKKGCKQRGEEDLRCGCSFNNFQFGLWEIWHFLSVWHQTTISSKYYKEALLWFQWRKSQLEAQNSQNMRTEHGAVVAKIYSMLTQNLTVHSHPPPICRYWEFLYLPHTHLWQNGCKRATAGSNIKLKSSINMRTIDGANFIRALWLYLETTTKHNDSS